MLYYLAVSVRVARRVSGEEWLRVAAGGVAGEPVQDLCPGLGGVGEVDFGVSVGEAVVAE